MGLGWHNAGRAKDVKHFLGLSWQQVRRAVILELWIGLSFQKAVRSEYIGPSGIYCQLLPKEYEFNNIDPSFILPT